ncbi:MAG: CoA transferase, partial [Gammaproteobacteria bacterium]|nr:CoA transferase [Gammaproteobacteria bacterium]
GAPPNYTFYRCRDGKYLAVGALEPKFFLKLLGVLKEQIPAPLQKALDHALAGLSGKGRKSAGRSDKPKSDAGQFDKLNKLFGSPRQARLKTAPIRWALQAIFLTRTRDDCARLLEARDCCVTPILSIDESLRNEQIVARGMIEDDNGKPAFAFPVRFSDALAPAHPAPALGADNDAVLGATQ